MARLNRHRERYEVPGTARFLTFSCYQRLRLFDNDRIKAEFVRRLKACGTDLNVLTLAWVIMPEHVHLVVFPTSDATITQFLHRLKGPFSRAVVRRWMELDAPILNRVEAPDGNRFWERGGGYDRNVTGHELLEKIRYCHRNPITRGLCKSSVEWMWSSARMYEQRADAVGPEIPFDLLPRTSEVLT